MNTVFNILPIYPDESLACYLLRLATSESVCGIAGLIGHLKIGTNNAGLNKNIELLVSFTVQPADALRNAMVCPAPAHRSLREKFARLASNPFCPHCLRENGYFKRAWRHGLVTACARHSCELVDTCPSCSQTIDHGRPNAFFCHCGQELATIKPRMAPPSAIWASAHISGDSHEEPGWPTLGNVTDADWSTFDDLIFMFGNYSNQNAEPTYHPRKYLGTALNQLEVLKRTGLNESVLKQLTRVGLLPKRARAVWDLNVRKPYDLADVQAVESFLFGLIESNTATTHTIALNEINRRIGTSRMAIDEVFEHIAQGTLRPINAGEASHLGQLLFDKDALTHLIGSSQAVTLMTAEHLARITGWKSESIRHWVKSGFLAGEPAEARGRVVYWVGMRAVHDFMGRYKVISELARQLETSPKSLTEKLHKMGIPILGAQAVAPGVTRGGLVELKQILVRGLYQPQMSLLADEPPVHQVEEPALA
jgi:hypothetical protein